MKCTDHPFYPRRYCYGCSFRSRPCAVCGKKESELIEIEVETGGTDECERIEVCSRCRDTILSMEGTQYIRTYDGKRTVRRTTIGHNSDRGVQTPESPK